MVNQVSKRALKQTARVDYVAVEITTTWISLTVYHSRLPVMVHSYGKFCFMPSLL